MLNEIAPLLDAQETSENIETLRREAEILYDPLIRTQVESVGQDEEIPKKPWYKFWGGKKKTKKSKKKSKKNKTKKIKIIKLKPKRKQARKIRVTRCKKRV